ncbi:hypothetical protein NSMS1_08380 [Nostoc sp. MS1]|nr:hypothetical protein NSMS1_08380 [Nostoc sp. MS1]
MSAILDYFIDQSLTINKVSKIFIKRKVKNRLIHEILVIWPINMEYYVVSK